MEKKIEELADQLVDWQAKQEAELKQFGETDKATQEAITTFKAKLDELHVQVNKISADVTPNVEARKSLADHIIDSPEYKAGKKSFDIEVKDIISTRLTDATYGIPVIPEYIPGVVGEPEISLVMENLIPSVTTTSNAVYWVEETFVNAAAVVGESAQGNAKTKPESTLKFVPKSTTVEKIAHNVSVTTEALSDSNILRQEIDSKLVYGALLKKDVDIVGKICNAATPYDEDLIDELGVTDATRIDHLRAAIYQAREARYPASGIVINPFDWAAIELAKGSDKRYVWINVNDGGVERLWRLPVVVSDNLAPGAFIVGAFRMGATIYNKEGIGVKVYEQHDDYAKRNLVLVQAELRYALAITRPQAFVCGTFEGYGS